MTKSVLYYLLFAMTGLLIQSTVFRDNFPGIAAPDFVLLLVLCLAQRFQNTAGVFIAFGLGLLGDFASGQFLGPFAAGSVAAYSLLVYLSDKVFAEKGLALCCLAFVASTLKSFTSLLMIGSYRGLTVLSWSTFTSVFAEALFTALFAPFVFWLTQQRGGAGKSSGHFSSIEPRAQRGVRWPG